MGYRSSASKKPNVSLAKCVGLLSPRIDPLCRRGTRDYRDRDGDSAPASRKKKEWYLMSQAADQKPTGTKPRSEAEERLIAWLEKEEGRKLTEPEKNLAIAQAESVGDLLCRACCRSGQLPSDS